MPRICDPDATFKVILLSDQGKENPPAFIFRYASSRQWRKIAEIADRIDVGTDAGKMLDEVIAVIKKFIIGWESMTEPGGAEIVFDVEKLEDLLTPSEITEILMGAVAQIPTVEDKKKLDLP